MPRSSSANSVTPWLKKNGAAGRLACLQAAMMEEIRQFELRPDDAIQPGSAPGPARALAAFDDEDRRVPITSAATTRPDRAAVSTVSARLATTNADEGGDAARELSRTTVVQHDEHQRDPTNAHDIGAREPRNAS